MKASKRCVFTFLPLPFFYPYIIYKSKLKGKEHMIENEIEIMKLCNQPNIVKLIEEFETQTEIYLIMELVKVREKEEKLTKGKTKTLKYSSV